MNIEEKRKIEEMYEKGLVEISSIIEPLIENFKIDRCSIDIQQCQLVIDYLIRDRDFDENYIQQLEEELEKEKEKNKNLEIELEIKKYCKVNELTSDLIYYKNLARAYQGNCISKDKLKEIVDECIPKKENIITRELEYTPNANANSYLTQEILSLLKEVNQNV